MVPIFRYREIINEEIKAVRNEFRNKTDRKKMDNIMNNDDPALIKNTCLSFYKSTSKK